MLIQDAPSGGFALSTGDPVSWETIVVSLEILAALSLALWLIYRRASRDVLMLGGDYDTMVPLSPLTQPRGWCSVKGLSIYRLAVAVFYVVVEVYDTYRTDGRCLVFYTSWNFILQGSYFAVAGYRTHSVWRNRVNESSATYARLLDEGVGLFQAKRRLARTTRRGWLRLDLVLDVCIGTATLIVIVVWTILYPYAKKIGHPEALLNWVSYCQHGINIGLLQIDFVLSQHSVSLDALPLMVAWPTVYCIFTWIVHGTIKHGFWPYPFLKLDTPWAPLWYGGLLLAHLLAYVLQLYLTRLKELHREPPVSPELSPSRPGPLLVLLDPYGHNGVDTLEDDAELLLHEV